MKSVEEPQTMRIEFLTPLVVTQPIEQPEDKFINLINYPEQPSPKDASVDDWAEFDNSWMEGSPE